jgi:hypothetical protein
MTPGIQGDFEKQPYREPFAPGVQEQQGESHQSKFVLTASGWPNTGINLHTSAWSHLVASSWLVLKNTIVGLYGLQDGNLLLE